MDSTTLTCFNPDSSCTGPVKLPEAQPGIVTWEKFNPVRFEEVIRVPRAVSLVKCS